MKAIHCEQEGILGDMGYDRLFKILGEKPAEAGLLRRATRGAGQTAVAEFRDHPVRDLTATGLVLVGAGLATRTFVYKHRH